MPVTIGIIGPGCELWNISVFTERRTAGVFVFKEIVINCIRQI